MSRGGWASSNQLKTSMGHGLTSPCKKEFSQQTALELKLKLFLQHIVLLLFLWRTLTTTDGYCYYLFLEGKAKTFSQICLESTCSPKLSFPISETQFLFYCSKQLHCKALKELDTSYTLEHPYKRELVYSTDEKFTKRNCKLKHLSVWFCVITKNKILQFFSFLSLTLYSLKWSR